MSRTTSQTSTANAPPAAVHARSLSLKTNNTKLSNPIPPSDVKLFVTNLRLIDLDLREDWPNITVQTFSAKNADQKQRIGAAEWSLFRLFEIWDPVETSQRLQPFFPPLEPLQSRNLRIALHRSLDTLKKDGILGRETVLRKTMLDECKGEKFYEILASFSAIVLKKVLASQPKPTVEPAIARSLALSTTLPAEAQYSLLPLAIAHKVALANVLRRKEEKRRRFIEFGAMLDRNADEISERMRKAVGTPRAIKNAVPEKEAQAIKKQLKDNWVGDQRWVEVMLQGDNVQSGAAFLESPFDRVWGFFEQGRRLEDAVPEAGLLENLQLRVEEQQARLQKWKSFHEKMQETKILPGQQPKKVVTSLKEIKFDDHLQFQLPRTIPESKRTLQQLQSKYQDIVSEMGEDLSQAASARYTQSSIAPSTRARPAPQQPTQPRQILTRPVVKAKELLKPVKSAQSPNRDLQLEHKTRTKIHDIPAATPADSEATLIGQVSTTRTTTAMPPADEPSIEDVYEMYHTEDTPDSAPISATSTEAHPFPVEEPSLSSSPPPPSSYYPSEPPLLELPIDTEEALAAQIVSTIGEATPSPVKKPQPRLSLMERTRMTMSRTPSFEPIAETLEMPSPQLPQLSPTMDEAQLDRHAALLERTRMSMAAMASKPRVSLAPKEKSKPRRQSSFPVNQFDTPRGRKSLQAVEEAKGQRTPQEDLFSDDIDYDRIFKSRPRIATSPAPAFGTPVVNDEEEPYEEDVTGIDLGDVDNDEDEEGFEQSWENSPLRARQARNV